MCPNSEVIAFPGLYLMLLHLKTFAPIVALPRILLFILNVCCKFMCIFVGLQEFMCARDVQALRGQKKA